MKDRQPEKDILDVLHKVYPDELATKEVAERANMAPNTASKYLGLLERDGKVVMREKKPFKFWKLKDRGKT